MRRRTLLAIATTGLAEFAGCVSDAPGESDDGTGDGEGGDENDDGGDGESEGGDGESEDGDDSDGDSDDGADRPDLSEASLEGREECESEGDAEVTFATDEDTVRVRGCVVGEDGCRIPVLDRAGYDDDVFRVVVATEDDSDDDTSCTQALTERGYHVEATFEDGTPSTLEVDHDDANGRETVTTAERN